MESTATSACLPLVLAGECIYLIAAAAAAAAATTTTTTTTILH